MAILPIYGFLLKTFGKSWLKSLISIKKLQKKFTDQNMTVFGFSGRSVKYKKREFYISWQESAVDLKFSPELDIVKTNLMAKFQPNQTNGCPGNWLFRLKYCPICKTPTTQVAELKFCIWSQMVNTYHWWKFQVKSTSGTWYKITRLCISQTGINFFL